VFLRKYLCSTDAFRPRIIVSLKKDLQAIGDMGNGAKFLSFGQGEDSYDRVTDRVVEWCKANPVLLPHKRNPSLKR
jgi:hypothetical protein